MSACKILIVDDDTDDVEILSDAFTQSGVESVHYVHSAMEAFIYLQKFETKEDLPKLIVTDHFLPGITGPELLEDLKGMEKYKHIPIVVLSSTKSPKEIEKYKQLGAVDYIVKPSSYDDYMKVAQMMLDRLNL